MNGLLDELPGFFESLGLFPQEGSQVMQRGSGGVPVLGFVVSLAGKLLPKTQGAPIGGHGLRAAAAPGEQMSLIVQRERQQLAIVGNRGEIPGQAIQQPDGSGKCLQRFPGPMLVIQVTSQVHGTGGQVFAETRNARALGGQFFQQTEPLALRRFGIGQMSGQRQAGGMVMMSGRRLIFVLAAAGMRLGELLPGGEGLAQALFRVAQLTGSLETQAEIHEIGRANILARGLALLCRRQPLEVLQALAESGHRLGRSSLGAQGHAQLVITAGHIPVILRLHAVLAR